MEFRRERTISRHRRGTRREIVAVSAAATIPAGRAGWLYVRPPTKIPPVAKFELYRTGGQSTLQPRHVREVLSPEWVPPDARGTGINQSVVELLTRDVVECDR